MRRGFLAGLMGLFAAPAILAPAKQRMIGDDWPTSIREDFAKELAVSMKPGAVTYVDNTSVALRHMERMAVTEYEWTEANGILLFVPIRR